MFKKLTLAAVIAIAGIMVAGQSEASAQNCGYGGYGGPSSFGAYSSPYQSSYRYSSPHRAYPTAYRSQYSPYRSGFGGYGHAHHGRSGYGSYYRGGPSIGISRRGLSIGFGF